MSIAHDVNDFFFVTCILFPCSYGLGFVVLIDILIPYLLADARARSETGNIYAYFGMSFSISGRRQGMLVA
jgi:hypothetical protein